MSITKEQRQDALTAVEQESPKLRAVLDALYLYSPQIGGTLLDIAFKHEIGFELDDLGEAHAIFRFRDNKIYVDRTQLETNKVEDMALIIAHEAHHANQYLEHNLFVPRLYAHGAFNLLLTKLAVEAGAETISLWCLEEMRLNGGLLDRPSQYNATRAQSSLYDAFFDELEDQGCLNTSGLASFSAYFNQMAIMIRVCAIDNLELVLGQLAQVEQHGSVVPDTIEEHLIDEIRGHPLRNFKPSMVDEFTKVSGLDQNINPQDFILPNPIPIAQNYGRLAQILAALNLRYGMARKGLLDPTVEEAYARQAGNPYLNLDVQDTLSAIKAYHLSGQVNDPRLDLVDVIDQVAQNAKKAAPQPKLIMP